MVQLVLKTLLLRRSNNNNATSANNTSGGGGVYRPIRKGRKAAKVEPKTYFANERTFIQWISAALLLTIISVWLLEFLESGYSPAAPLTAGIVLNSTSVFLIFYAIYTYYARLRLIQSGSPYGYVDKLGPFLLACASFVGICMLLYYYIDYYSYTIPAAMDATDNLNNALGYDPFPPPTEPPEPEPITKLTPLKGSCFQRPINVDESSTITTTIDDDSSSNNMFESSTIITAGTKSVYEPSDIFVDQERNVMLVPSLQYITGLNLAADPSSTPLQTLTALEENDHLEAITYVEDRIFAISQGSIEGQEDYPSLVELQWAFGTGSLVVMNRWKLLFKQRPINGIAEGMTYVPGGDSNRNNGNGLLYISGDVYDPLTPESIRRRGMIYTFDVPSRHDTSGELDRHGMLNSKLINSGLKDAKISSMQYFHGILFVLHGHEKKLRLWDIHKAVLLSETRLPNLDGKEFDENWQGMFLEDATSNNRLGRRTLRRRKTQEEEEQEIPLVLHLALNTPPEIWSFDVVLLNKVDENQSYLIFPECAGVKMS